MREYISYRVPALEKLFDDSGQRPEMAEEMIKELKLRSSARAKIFEKRLIKILHGDSKDRPNEDSQPSSPSSNKAFLGNPKSALSAAGFGVNFPVSDFYRGQIVDARTIKNTGKWWTAILVVDDPKTGKRFAKMYKWEKRNGEWKVKNSFSLSSRKQLRSTIDALSDLEEKID